jgi:calcium/calmodulin-dependent serine protein kinase
MSIDTDDEQEVKFEQEFKLLDVIYTGTFNSVYKCKHKPTKEVYAVKVVDMPSFLNVYSKEDLANEVKICSKLTHPHIVQLFTSASSNNKFYMVYEFLDSRDLCFEIEQKVANFVYSEFVASHYLRQVLEALQFMHNANIIHRDIKVNCVLLASSDHVKIGGFGSAVVLPERGFIQDHHRSVGTIQYMSPEVVRKEYYGRPCDVWGVGVLLYVLLTGVLPFLGKATHVSVRILYGPDLTNKRWRHISVPGRDLCQKMLIADQYSRITVSEALKHPWITGDNSKTALTATIRELSKFNSRRKLQTVVSAAANSSKFDEFDMGVSGVDVLPAVPDSVSDSQSFSNEHTSVVSRACTKAVNTVIDSIEEGQILSSCELDSTYLNSLFEDKSLCSLLKLYDRIAVEMADSLSGVHEPSQSFWAKASFSLSVHVSDQLERLLPASTHSPPSPPQTSNYGPGDNVQAIAEQLYAILNKPHLTALLQARDVLFTELYGSGNSSDVRTSSQSPSSTIQIGSSLSNHNLPNGVTPNDVTAPLTNVAPASTLPPPTTTANSTSLVRVK